MAGRQLLAVFRGRDPFSVQKAFIYKRLRVGKREYVGFGINGEAAYFDRVDYPLPSVRFKEDTPEILVIKEKEKGDWKKLSIADKKALYRASFCQTFAEIKAPTGEWKSITGLVMVGISVGIWVFIAIRKNVYPPLPDTVSPENQKRVLQYMIDNRVNPITGVASKWDYEKNRWKD